MKSNNYTKGFCEYLSKVLIPFILVVPCSFDDSDDVSFDDSIFPVDSEVLPKP